MEKSWFVVKAISGQENKIKVQIENEIERNGYTEYLEEILVPMEKVFQVRNGKRIAREKTYFPGYIMVKADLSGEIPHIIKSVTGVIGFLGETKGGEPVALRKSEVQRMLGKVDQLIESDGIASIPYNVGETVKVIDGPFSGFNGTIEKVLEQRRKLEVSVLIFGRKTPLELGFMQVDKLS